MNDLISRQTVLRCIKESRDNIDWGQSEDGDAFLHYTGALYRTIASEECLPSAEPEPEKYEYHYDHTDCIWYRPEARNRCPATCAQYRDGWNDAMNYIFRDGEGYRPFRRDKKYEG